MIGNTHRRFWKAFEKLPARIQDLAREKYATWKRDPFHPSLGFEERRNNVCVVSGPRVLGSVLTFDTKREDWGRAFMTPFPSVGLSISSSSLRSRKSRMAPIRRQWPKRSRCGRRAFPVHRQAAIQGQDQFNKWPADGQRRSNT